VAISSTASEEPRETGAAGKATFTLPICFRASDVLSCPWLKQVRVACAVSVRLVFFVLSCVFWFQVCRAAFDCDTTAELPSRYGPWVCAQLFCGFVSSPHALSPPFKTCSARP